MKSLNENVTKNNNPKIFTDEIMKFIDTEGFEYGNNDSYCSGFLPSEYKYEDKCYKKNVHSDRYTINVYIFSFGIGVDFDYDCGGNSSNQFWTFDDYSFETAYDEMVDEVNDRR